MIDVSFAGDTMSEVRAQMLEFLGVEGVAPKAAANVKKPEAPKVEQPATTESAPKTDAPAAVTPPTYKDVADLIPKLVAKHGKPKIVAFLDSFGGAKNGKDLKVEQYAEFIAKAKTEFPL